MALKDESHAISEFIDVANGHIFSNVLKTSIELGVFDTLGAMTRKGSRRSVEHIAKACGCSKNGVKILLDALVLKGFLTKSSPKSSAYDLSHWSAIVESIILADAVHWYNCDEFTELVRNNLNTVVISGKSESVSLSEKDTLLQKYSQNMTNFNRSLALKVATSILSIGGKRDLILDVGSGHGLVGPSLATMELGNDDTTHERSKLVTIDKSAALGSAFENAANANLKNERYTQVKGDPVSSDWGKYKADSILFVDYLNECDWEEVLTLLKKAKRSLKENGSIYIVETFSNEENDLISPVITVPLLMLTKGSVRSFMEYKKFCLEVGFKSADLISLPNSKHSVIVLRNDSKRVLEIPLESEKSKEIFDRNKHKIVPREGFSSPEENTWSYPMSLGDFVGLVERMVLSSI
eukprot:CAMPEP_0171460732 /NCGR_PEP_ID=MMETSP0945-20130129/5487_1 /TAXON_ID=109269 /ORGANISM="Vaucheria litorea, Strain CCMP2940" /LENGTH=408 /DNA_ID=CAMNT_0011986987 /DNA_START=9 /DNA_END=1233 /DNA_ORIENTATION=-